MDAVGEVGAPRLDPPLSDRRAVRTATAFGFGAGMVVTGPAILLAVMSGGAGHGDYGLARALFPLPMLGTLLEGRIGAGCIAAILAQFPLYGAVAGRAVARRSYRLATLVAVIHAAAVVVCFSGAISQFD